MGLDRGIMRPYVSQDITVAATSATHTNAFSAQTYVVRLCATTACRYRIGVAGGDTAVTTDTYLPANFIEYIQVTPGYKIYAIQESAGGKLNVTEMTS